MDGSLILWGPQAEFHPASVREAFLEEGLLPAWDRIQALSRHRELALAGYISHPGSMEVVNLLRLALCPHQVALCERCPPAARECDALAGLRDRDLFGKLLGPGQRSPVFVTGSSVVRQRYRQHQVCFFYLHTGEEIGRVEVPQWVADPPELLELAHALVWDQVQRGRGYPVALAEAHEQAVVTPADREFFWALVDQALGEVGLPTATSAKSRSKRLKWA